MYPKEGKNILEKEEDWVMNITEDCRCQVVKNLGFQLQAM